MILAQSRGEMILSHLCRNLHSSMETIERRAHELGIRLIKRRPGDKRGRAMPQYQASRPYRPVWVSVDDPLMNTCVTLRSEIDALMEAHGDRRYESLTMATRKQQ